MEGTGWIGDVTPIDFARSTTLSGPTSIVSRA
jgi:hypothetical protein